MGIFKTLRQKTGLAALAKGALEGATLYRGLKHYQKTGVTPPPAYHSLRKLHCRTRGRSNDVLHRMLQRRHPPQPWPASHGVLGELSDADLQHISAEMNQHGFFVFAQRLPVELCERLEQLALQTPSLLHPPQKDAPETAIYNRQNLLAPTYHLPEAALVADPDVQRLISDVSLIGVAQSYLQIEPVLQSLVMWWSTTHSKEASSAAAQMYHFDMDRIRCSTSFSTCPM